MSLLAPPDDAVHVSLGTTSPHLTIAESVDVDPTSWTTVHTVALNHLADAVARGSRTVAVQVDPGSSPALDYAALSPTTLLLQLQDDDEAQWTTAGGPWATSEDGGTSRIWVSLDTEPVAEVHVDVASHDTSEVQVTPTRLTFSAADWSTPQALHIAGVDDTEPDGPVAVLLAASTAASVDPHYARLPPRDLLVTNHDDEHVQGVLIDAPAHVDLYESSPAGETFTVRLSHVPNAAVQVPITTSDLACT